MTSLADMGLPQGLPEMLGTQAKANNEWLGGSACFCSGKCRELGYCPNQGFQARDFLEWAKGRQ